MSETLTIERASKTFGNKLALDGVSLSVPAEAFCVLLGPSGSGKTTLLRCVAGIERLSAGSVTIGGRQVAAPGRHLAPERRDLAMVFQDYALWPHMSARKNVEFALGRSGAGRKEARAAAGKILQRMGLGHLSDSYPGELSGGEQQRVALARALVADTGLVLFDEPLSNLDADLRERMRLEISTMVRQAKTTAVYITHDQAEAFALADVMGVMAGGRMLQFGTPEEVYRHPASPFVARFTGLAGELPVEILANGESTPTAEGPMVRVRPGGSAESLLAVPPPGYEGLRPGSDAVMLVRPGAVELVPPGTADSHLRGETIDAAYRGHGYDHAVHLEGGQRLVGVHHPERYRPGTPVALRLRTQGCLVFSADQPAEQLAGSPASSLGGRLAASEPRPLVPAGEEV